MTNQENKTIFSYLLDVITRRKETIPNESLPEEIKEDIQFAVWMQNLDFSTDSQIKASLRSNLQKQAELMSSAGRIKSVTEKNLQQEKPKPISLGALIGLIAGGVSILAATILLIFQKTKKEVSDKQTA